MGTSFFSMRVISIQVDDIVNQPFSMNAGCSQSSLVTPILFLLFVTNLSGKI